MSAAPAPHPVTRAALWMTGALLSFTAMAVAARELSAELSTFQILLFRSLIGLVVISLLIQWKNPALFSTPQFGWHAWRNLAHFGGQYGWFYGIAFIPLAEVFAIEFTVPVWTALCATAVLGERLTRSRAATIALGLLGVVVILRPGLALVHPAALAVLAGAMAYGVAHTLTKKLAARDSPMTILFYMTLLQLPLGLIPAAIDWTTPAAALWPHLAAVGLTGLTAHYCMTRALALADATVVVPMDFLRLPLVALLGLALYGERLEWPLFAGAGLILAGILLSLRAERTRR
ncbi:MAG TPA: DMT family transporter [Rhodocyclaceae bacterium]|nr:DMT family transporter [Rhodocyclaceae bacterium]